MSRRLPAAVSAAVFMLPLMALTSASASAGGHTPTEIAAARRDIIRAMLTDEFKPYLIANARRNCAMGREPAEVAESRSQGAYFTPDASDGCLAALVRTAHDGQLSDLYRDLLAKLGGDVAAVDRWPRAIGDAVLGGKTSASIGNHKAIEVTPALALDAGFTVGYRSGAASNATSDAGQLKALAESCLTQHQDAGTCYSVGYMFGTQASAGRTATVR